MQRIIYFFLFTCIFTTNPLTAIVLKDMPETQNKLRILELLPNLLCPLAVDPCIPIDFIALSPKGTSDPYDWIYWGPEGVLKDYFKNPSSLKAPVLRVKLSANVSQTSSSGFNNTESFKLLEKESPEGFSSIETQWGDYPINALQMQQEGYITFVAWVGLNDPEAGWTLMFNLVYPNEKGLPSKEDVQLWENFIRKTKPLKDGDYFKAYGQDLQEGYTIVNVSGANLKMIAEKRQRDGTLQIVVIPESSDIEFRYDNMLECSMGAKWKQGEPMVKVYGDIIIKDKNSEFTTNNVTSIFIKTVPDFSLKKDDDKKFLVFQKKTDKVD